MTEPKEKQPTQDEIKKRAIKRIGMAVALAAVAAVGLTLLSYNNKPVPQPQQTVLPADPMPNRQAVSAVEPQEPPAQPVSAVAETPPEKDAPPVITPPPPPQVLNQQQPQEAVNKAAKPAPKVEPTGKDSKPPVQKPAREMESASAPTLVPAEKNAKQRISPEPTPATRETANKASEAAARVSEAKKSPEPQKTPETTKPPVAEKSAAPPPAPQTAATAGGGGGGKGYAVQLGVFKDLSNAMQMQDKLTQQGIQSYTETKLNVGPFKNKAEAEQAMAKLRGLGINAILVPLK